MIICLIIKRSCPSGLGLGSGAGRIGSYPASRPDGGDAIILLYPPKAENLARKELLIPPIEALVKELFGDLPGEFPELSDGNAGFAGDVGEIALDLPRKQTDALLSRLHFEESQSDFALPYLFHD